MDYTIDAAYRATYTKDPPNVYGNADNLMRMVSAIKFAEKAKKLAHFGNHSKLNFRMAAYVVKGGNVLSKAFNYGYNHAESRAIRKWGPRFEGATIYIMRRNGMCSRPCQKCLNKIIDAGISDMVYVNSHGELIKESVNNYRDLF